MAEASRAAAGQGSKRVALWLIILALPVLYEASVSLAGPRAFFKGNGSYWFSGFQVDLVLMAAAAAVVGWAAWRSGEGKAALGWPSRLPAWQWVAVGLTLALAVAGALLYHPPMVSSNVYSVSASSPVTRLERLALVFMALVDAVVQESVWRGAAITWLRPVLGPAAAAILAGGAFLFLHPATGTAWSELLVRGLAAAVYTTLFFWRRSTGPGMYLHFIVGAGQLLSPIAAH